MSLADHAGLAGAVVGLGFGLVHLALAARVMGRFLPAEGEALAPGATEEAARHWRRMRGALRLVCFGIFPLVGFIAGRWLG